MDFESAIRQYVFMGRTGTNGWASVLCRVCNDHGGKGPRAGFKFGPGEFGYHCFNCEIGAQFNENSTDMPSDKLKTICAAYGIPDEFISDLELQVIQNRTNGNAVGKRILDQSRVSGAKVLDMPSFFVPLLDLPEDDPIRVLATMHLEEERRMTVTDYPFLVARSTDDPNSKKWANRLIIPVYNNNNQLIFWQGRDMVGNKTKKYLSVDSARDGVMYGMSEIYNRTNAPLFVTEGFFDAFHVKGCATLGRQLTPSMISMLNSSTREKVIIPDRFGDGADLAMSALRLNWKVATPDIGQCKDITEAIVKYGKLYVIKNIMDNIYSGTAAETMIGLYCSTREGK